MDNCANASKGFEELSSSFEMCEKFNNLMTQKGQLEQFNLQLAQLDLKYYVKEHIRTHRITFFKIFFLLFSAGLLYYLFTSSSLLHAYMDGWFLDPEYVKFKNPFFKLLFCLTIAILVVIYLTAEKLIRPLLLRPKYKEKVAENRQKIQLNLVEISKLEQDILKFKSFMRMACQIPERYWYAYSYLESYFRDCRALTLHQAINIYEAEVQKNTAV